MCPITQESERPQQQQGIVVKRTFDPFAGLKFNEEAAEKTKAHAWAQTSWILALNAGILAFSTNLYAEHRTIPGFLVIEWLCFVAAAILCLYLVYCLTSSVSISAATGQSPTS